MGIQFRIEIIMDYNHGVLGDHYDYNHPHDWDNGYYWGYSS